MPLPSALLRNTRSLTTFPAATMPLRPVTCRLPQRSGATHPAIPSSAQWWRTNLLCARTYATSPPPSKRSNLESNNKSKSFVGQVYESTHDRIKRERAEQAKFKPYVTPENPWTHGLGVLAGFALCGGLGFYWASQLYDPIDNGSTKPLAKLDTFRHNISLNNMHACWTDLRDIVGIENISTEVFFREAHASSEWSSHPFKEKDVPFAVVQPKSTEEVSEIMKICHYRLIPVTAYSGGTSLEGHFAATNGGICIDFSRMDNIIEVHKEDLDCVVQPAVGWERLNEELAAQGLFFPPDPGPGAMIGGMVGTGCSGTNAYKYGTMKDWVISLTVVLADGTIIKTRQRPRKSSAGYDLTRIFVGSEGTLGLVTEATLKVTVKPAATSVAVSSFNSIREAADCVSKVVGAAVPIAAIEILDDCQMQCINASGMTAKTWKEAPTLFFKFSGTPDAVKEQVSMVQKLAKSSGSKSFEFAKNDQEAEELWSARKEALWSVMAKKREGDHVWTTDVAVPISKLPQIIEETKADLTRCGLFATIVGHVGDGNFHTIVLYNDEEREVAEDLVHRMVKRAIEMEGTATGEHGVGLVKRDYLPHELGETTVDLMRRMKLAFDPLCLLNCDKIIRMKKPQAGEIAEW